jgi:hypothetical protein
VARAAPETAAPSATDAGTPRAPEAADAGGAQASLAPVDTGSACNEQAPQDFLVRKNFLPRGSAEEIKKRQAIHQESIRYRTEKYGYFKGFGKPEWNAHEPSYYTVEATFMGLPVRMNKRVVPALKCVEEEIKKSCSDHPYTPHALAGIRFKNTYRGGEVTNHAYGIAIDVDPHLNTCCGCVKPWSTNPQCTKPAKTEYDRMAMPECWVHAFERYGFYWLGHDVLQDTMHYEFLGDPDKILKDTGTVSTQKP